MSGLIETLSSLNYPESKGPLRDQFLSYIVPEARERSWLASSEITPSVVLGVLNDPDNFHHDSAHYQRVANIVIFTMFHIPDVVRQGVEMADELTDVTNAVLLAAGTHDNVLVSSGSKLQHAQLQAAVTYVRLHDYKESLGLTDEQIYMAAACTFHHPFKNAQFAGKYGYVLPRLKDIVSLADNAIQAKEGQTLVEARPTLTEIVARILSDDEIPDYPDVDVSLVRLAAERFMVADEIDAVIPSAEANLRTVLTYPNRAFWEQTGEQVSFLMQTDLAKHDVMRVMQEAGRFVELREVGMKAFESGLLSLYWRSRLKNLKEMTRLLASDDDLIGKYVYEIFDRYKEDLRREAKKKNREHLLSEAMDKLMLQQDLVNRVLLDKRLEGRDANRAIEEIEEVENGELSVTGPMLPLNVADKLLSEMQYKYLDWSW